MRKNPEHERIAELEEELTDIRDRISSVLEEDEDETSERAVRGRNRR